MIFYLSINPLISIHLFRRHTSRLSPKPRHLPQPIPISIEQEQTGNEDKGQKTWDATCPVDAQRLVKLASEQRKPTCNQ